MWFPFIANNLHFALEFFGALVFFTAAWFAADALYVRHNFTGAARFVGFGALGAGQVIHAMAGDAGVWIYAGELSILFGFAMVLWNLYLEQPDSLRPEFKAILLLPALPAFFTFSHTSRFLLAGAIAFLTWRQHHRELKKALKPLWVGFSILALSALAGLAVSPETLGPSWIVEHGLKLIAFSSLLVWVWQYLQLRIREELMLIFVSGAVLVSIIATLIFSIVLVSKFDANTRATLQINAKILEFSITRLRDEATAKSRIVAEEGGLARALARKDFAGLERLASSLLTRHQLGFLTIADAEGEVVIRAHDFTRRGDRLDDTLLASALAGKGDAAIALDPAEAFSVRAASPLVFSGKKVGVAVAGFKLDSAFADGLQQFSGLDVALFAGDTLVATSLYNPDGRTRPTGIRETNEEVRQSVLIRGETATVRTALANRPILASFIPLWDSKRRVVGMLASLKTQRDVLALVNVTNRLALSTVTAIMVALAVPVYFLTRRVSRELSENLTRSRPPNQTSA